MIFEFDVYFYSRTIKHFDHILVNKNQRKIRSTLPSLYCNNTGWLYQQETISQEYIFQLKMHDQGSVAALGWKTLIEYYIIK